MSDFPSFPEMAKTLLIESCKHMLNGCAHILIEDFKKRLEICNKCEFLKDGRCVKCGCFMNIKARWETTKCPIGKW